MSGSLVWTQAKNHIDFRAFRRELFRQVDSIKVEVLVVRSDRHLKYIPYLRIPMFMIGVSAPKALPIF